MPALYLTLDKKKMSYAGVRAAVEAAGSQALLASSLGVTQQAVSLWVRRGFVPVSRVVEIETQFGVDRAELVNPRTLELLTPRGFE